MNVGFIGAGKMAQAMAKGFISAGLSKGSNIIGSCAPQDTQCVDEFKSMGAAITFDNKEVTQKADVIFLAVKPHIVPICLKDITSVFSKTNLLVSVAGGVPIKKMEELLPKGSRVIRAMPNTPALVRQGASVFVRGSSATEQDGETVTKLLKSVGTCEEVTEYLLDAVTGLSGSGPAYIFLIIESLADGAVRMGIPRDLAYRLAAQTVVGAGTMVLETGEHPGKLKDDVMSPGGTTAAGLYHLEVSGLRSTLNGAIEAATKKSKELSSA
uniref:Pyrroline-5-carboxylate reductase n=1 Tax=Cacopsylla melanoneura TaxID=428564 RepID=A0A8D8PS32_9HEMI